MTRKLVPPAKVLVPVVTGNVSIAKLIIEQGKGSAEAPDVVVSGRLTVSEAVCNAGTAFVCGKGKATINSKTGDFDFCEVATYVDDEVYADLSIYPNPATTTLYVQSGELPTGDAYIYDLSGRIYKTVALQGEEITEVSVESLPAGMYIFRLGSQSLRFIKK